MQELIIEIAIYLAIATLLGLLLGYLVWGLQTGAQRETASESAAARRARSEREASLRHQVETVTRERDDLAARVETLSAELAAASNAVEAPGNAPEDASKHWKETSDNPDEGGRPAARLKAATKKLQARLDTQVPEDRDDLTQIKGIGEATANALNRNGIWRLRELADLSPELVADLKSELGPQMGRSVDFWVEQARDLCSADTEGQ